jgi:hypothetical protein
MSGWWIAVVESNTTGIGRDIAVVRDSCAAELGVAAGGSR